jgi:hypothetical protein
MLDLSRAFCGLSKDAHFPADPADTIREFCLTKVPDRTTFSSPAAAAKNGEEVRWQNAKTASE